MGSYVKAQDNKGIISHGKQERQHKYHEKREMEGEWDFMPYKANKGNLRCGKEAIDMNDNNNFLFTKMVWSHFLYDSTITSNTASRYNNTLNISIHQDSSKAFIHLN